MTVLVMLLTLVVALQSMLVVGLLRSHGVILRRLHELGAGVATQEASEHVTPPDAVAGGLLPRPPTETDLGMRASDITGVSPDGEVVAIRVGDVEHDTVLAFLSSSCTTCEPFWQGMRTPGVVGPSAGGVRLVVVTQGPEAEAPAELRGLASPGIPVVMSTEAWRDYHVPGSPFVTAVSGRTGRVKGSGTAADWSRVMELLDLASDDDAASRLPRWRAAADLEREHDLDQVLLAARIGPGHPSLYPASDRDGTQ